MQKTPDTQKFVKKITQSRLQNVALYYLDRFGGTEKSVRNMLHRRIQKSLQVHPDQDINTIRNWVDMVIAKCIDYGYINDSVYTKTRIQKLLDKGKSLTFITHDLYAKGVKSEIIDHHISTYDMVKINAKSVYIYVQKYRLGVHRYDNQRDIDTYMEKYQDYTSDHYKQHQKDLLKCAKQGFSYTDSQNALLDML